jgi:hypothetical protein
MCQRGCGLRNKRSARDLAHESNTVGRFGSFTDIESTKSFRGAAAPTGMVHSSSSVTVENGLCAAEKAVEGLVRGAVRFPTRSFFASLRPR